MGTPYASALCVFGESIFAVILDHEVRAAKLTNRLISGCQWRRDALSDEHLVGTKFVRRERDVARSGILMRKWTLGVPVPMEPTRQEAIPTAVFPLALLPRHDSREFEMCGQGVHPKALKIRPLWCQIGRTLGSSACETLRPGNSHTRECKTFQDAWEESRTCGRRATAEVVNRGGEADQDTRTVDPCSSSTDPDPKQSKITTMTDVENLAEEMDEDTSLRTPATSVGS